MIIVGPITPLDLFKTLCMATEVKEFNDILFKAGGKKIKFIQEYFNEEICLADENSEEVKAQKKNDERKLDRQVHPVTAYYYRFPPRCIRPPPEKETIKNLFFWNALDIQSLDALA